MIEQRIEVSKRKIDKSFLDNLIKVQGDKSFIFHIIDRTTNQISIKKLYYIDNKLSELLEHYKFYSFNLNSSIPSVYSE